MSEGVRDEEGRGFAPAPLVYSDAKIRKILTGVKTIAVVGLSSDDNRPSSVVARYLQSKGCRVIPVNPALAGQEILGERAYARLCDIPVPVDMVDIFRASRHAGAIVDEALALGIKIIWMQLGVRDDDAAVRATAADAEIIMDRCPKIEWERHSASTRSP